MSRSRRFGEWLLTSAYIIGCFALMIVPFIITGAIVWWNVVSEAHQTLASRVTAILFALLIGLIVSVVCAIAGVAIYNKRHEVKEEFVEDTTLPKVI